MAILFFSLELSLPHFTLLSTTATVHSFQAFESVRFFFFSFLFFVLCYVMLLYPVFFHPLCHYAMHIEYYISTYMQRALIGDFQFQTSKARLTYVRAYPKFTYVGFGKTYHISTRFTLSPMVQCGCACQCSLRRCRARELEATHLTSDSSEKRTDGVSLVCFNFQVLARSNFNGPVD